jgi:hypothetical protein
MANIGVARRSSSLRRTDVRLASRSLRALILTIWRSRLRFFAGNTKDTVSENKFSIFSPWKGFL